MPALMDKTPTPKDPWGGRYKESQKEVLLCLARNQRSPVRLVPFWYINFPWPRNLHECKPPRLPKLVKDQVLRLSASMGDVHKLTQEQIDFAGNIASLLIFEQLCPMCFPIESERLSFQLRDMDPKGRDVSAWVVDWSSPGNSIRTAVDRMESRECVLISRMKIDDLVAKGYAFG